MTNKTSFSGRSIDVAVASAAKAWGVSPDELKYEVLAGKGGGFALIKVVSTSEASAQPMVEKISDAPRPPASESDDRRDDRRDHRGRDRDHGGRGRDRDRGGRGRDRDRGGRGRDRDRDRDRDRGGRGRDRRERSPRGITPFPSIPADSPTDVEGRVAEGCELSEGGQRCFEAMAILLEGIGFGMTYLVTEDDGRLNFDLESEIYHPVLVARDMALLDALEHLVDKMGNKDAENRCRITVDSQGIKSSQDTDLTQSAHDLADMAVERGQTMKMGPLDPRSRRIVHLALKEHDQVTTRSEGEGAFRQVCIVPKRTSESEEE